MLQTVPKKVAAVHDLSGFGRCSLTVVIPVLSSMGVQVCPVPTAVLSTHIGGFNDYSFIDLTNSIENYLKHWQSLNLKFDCFYSGFLGSQKQILIMSDYIKTLNPNSLIVIDPVFGDEGKLYSTFDNDFVISMRDYIKYANIITPNITEACLLLGEDYTPELSKEKIKEYLIRLSDFGADIVVITSVSIDANQKGVVAYDKINNRFWNVWCEYMPAEYPGTGDIFTSVMIGSLLNGDSLPIAIDRAVQFVSLAIRTTFGYTTPLRDGVFIEKILHTLSNEPHAFYYQMF